MGLKGDYPRRLSGFADGKDPDDLHGDTVVFEIVISIRRNGAMSVAGSINDHAYAKMVLESAIDSLGTYHARKRLGLGEGIIVPASDTALVGTEQEQALLGARHELADAMSGG
jgi:hypothetical protein